MCGHTGLITAITTVPAFLILGYFLYLGRDHPVGTRLTVLFFFAIQTAVLGKNLTDIFWLGHSPLLR